jgi:hypothetical protein
MQLVDTNVFEHIGLAFHLLDCTMIDTLAFTVSIDSTAQARGGH